MSKTPDHWTERVTLPPSVVKTTRLIDALSAFVTALLIAVLGVVGFVCLFIKEPQTSCALFLLIIIMRMKGKP